MKAGARSPACTALLLAICSLGAAVAATNFSAPRGDRTSGYLAQSRSEVLARNGMIASSQPLAAEAGLEILKRGGNAIDAAVAAAAVLNVVEPGSAGIGGDMFTIVWSAKDKQLLALNGSGRAPAGATLEHLRSVSKDGRMPQHGIDSVTVPGAVDGWDMLLKRLGSMGFRELLAPAARIAEEGFGVSERIRNDWIYGAKILAQDRDSVRTYLVNGHLPDNYAVFRNPDLAHSLHVLQEQGRDAFYSGEIGQAIVAKSQALNGTMTLEDLRSTHASWEKPLSTNYHGFDVYEFPPNTQGFAVLEMLNILEVCAPQLGMNLAALGPRSAQYWHFLVEAKKLAYADLYAFNGDPGFTHVPVERLISKSYAKELCAKIDVHKATVPEPKGDPVGGTVYLATADRFGNMVSFIYSVYDTFGSGITVPGYGFVLNDRGGLFSLDPKSPNVIAPGKRPFHTLLPGFLMKDGQPLMAFGLMGGSQQAQGHAQVLIDMIDLGANPQAASDAARFTHAQADNTLYLESQLYAVVGADLKAFGHHVVSTNGEDMGGYQSIWLEAYRGERTDGKGPIGGVYRGASDLRKDGAALGW
jgi:gamma-glutamyltranspeptidase/glutathione hydrolase